MIALLAAPAARRSLARIHPAAAAAALVVEASIATSRGGPGLNHFVAGRQLWTGPGGGGGGVRGGGREGLLTRHDAGVGNVPSCLRVSVAAYAGIATIEELRERRKQGGGGRNTAYTAGQATVGGLRREERSGGGGGGGGGGARGGPGGCGDGTSVLSESAERNNSIANARCPHDILSVVNENLDKLNAINVSTAFSKLGKQATWRDHSPRDLTTDTTFQTLLQRAHDLASVGQGLTLVVPHFFSAAYPT